MRPREAQQILVEAILNGERRTVAERIVARIVLQHRHGRREIRLLIGGDAGEQGRLENVARAEPSAAG